MICAWFPFAFGAERWVTNMEKYALNLGDDGRILSATFERFAPTGAVIVAELPQGDITEYRFVDGGYVHEPLPPAPETPKEPTDIERLEWELLTSYIAQAELYERTLALEEENVTTMMAVAELFEMILGGM